MSLATPQGSNSTIIRDHDFPTLWNEVKVDLVKKLGGATIYWLDDLLESDRLGVVILLYAKKVMDHYQNRLIAEKGSIDIDQAFEFIRSQVFADFRSLGLSPDIFDQNWGNLYGDLKWLLFLTINSMGMAKLLDGVADSVLSLHR